MRILILFVVFILSIVFGIVHIINELITMKRKVLMSKSTVDVFLKKRFDLIPNLVECVKGYAKYEQNTLEEIAKLRAGYAKDYNNQDGEKLNEYYEKFLALVESYPEIKASENFLKLQKTLIKVENEIQASRRIYIQSITRFNTKIKTIPTNIFAIIMGYKEFPLPHWETEQVNVNFES